MSDSGRGRKSTARTAAPRSGDPEDRNAGGRVVCETPTPDKKPTRIHRWKYELIRKAIMKVVPRRGEGLLFKELPERVRAQLSAADLEELGSVGWYTTVVKLNLEVTGELQRVEGRGPQRLLRGQAV